MSLPEDTSQPPSAQASAGNEEPVVEQPTTAPAKAAPAEQDEITRLLAAAGADLKARRLTSPVGNNAWDRYQRVLEIDPANSKAVAGMDRVIESYMELFGAAVEQEDFDKAAGYLAKIRELHPDFPVLQEGEQRLTAARRARKERMAEQERQRQAEEAARQAELERQRIEQAVMKHWESYEMALQAEDLDEATRILAQIRELNPEDPGLAKGEKRLTEAKQQQAIRGHWEIFEAALGENDFDKAANALSKLSELNLDTPNLSEGERRLADRKAAFVMELAGEMVSIPGGTFRMGDLSGDGKDNERPVHSVTVPAFNMGKHEVTVGQFQRFVEATEYRTAAERNADGKEGCYAYTAGEGWDWTWGRSWRRPGYSVGDDQPVVCVSWNDVQAFITWLTQQTGESYRLPTESEWEYAARAGSTTKYHFGNDESELCQYANHRDNSTDFDRRNKSCSDGVGNRSAAVGRYQPNRFGLYDVHGNVFEWVQDCYNDSYAGAPSDGRVWELGDCNRRVRRGGSWGDYSEAGRAANRGWGNRSSRNDALGFRLAQDK